MKKTNKFISFICSAAMAVSAFAGFAAVASADTEKGLTIEYDKANSTSTKAVLNIKAVGFELVDAWQANLQLPAGVTLDTTTPATVDALKTGFTTAASNYNAEANAYIAGGYTATEGTEESDLATVTLNFSAALTEDIEITVVDIGTIASMVSGYVGDDYDTLTFAKGNLTIPAVTVLADPSATPTPTPTPTATPSPTPIATAAPVYTIRPTAIAINNSDDSDDTTVVTKGLVVEYDKANSTSTKAVLNIKAVGFELVDAWQANLQLPAGVTLDTTTPATVDALKTGFTTAASNYNAEANAYIAGGYTATEGTEESDLATVTLNFSAALTEDIEITVVDIGTIASMVSGYVGDDYDTLTFAKGNLVIPAITVLADPTATVEPTPTPTAFPAETTIALKDALGEDYPATYTDGDDTYELVAVSVNTGSAAYGTDYVATYKGKALTAEEYHNAINGYTDTIADVIDGLVFNTKYDVTFKAAPMYQTADNKAKSEAGQEAEAVILMGYEGSATAVKPATPTPTPTATPDPSATPTAKPSSGGGSSRSGGSSTSTIASGSVTGGSSGVAVGTIGFTDLDTVPWAQTAINVLAAQGIINGRSDTIFDPLATVTRAEFTKLVCAAFGVPEAAPATATFTDVSGSDWYFGYVEAAAARGIVNGVSDTEFDPNALITREQMAAMMYRAITVTGATIKSGAALAFSDAASISDYAVESVNTLSAAGVINGMDDGTFAPKANASRAQAACIIYQYFMALVS